MRQFYIRKKIIGKNQNNMKKRFLFILLGAFALQLKAQDTIIRGHKTYLDSITVANSLTLLTPPPAPGTYEFFLDEQAYFQGKEERDTPRGEQAVRDAKISRDTILTHIRAQLDLGYFFATGHGCEKDETAAGYWWRQVLKNKDATEDERAGAQKNIELLDE